MENTVRIQDPSFTAYTPPGGRGKCQPAATPLRSLHSRSEELKQENWQLRFRRQRFPGPGAPSECLTWVRRHSNTVCDTFGDSPRSSPRSQAFTSWSVGCNRIKGTFPKPQVGTQTVSKHVVSTLLRVLWCRPGSSSADSVEFCSLSRPRR